MSDEELEAEPVERVDEAEFDELERAEMERDMPPSRVDLTERVAAALSASRRAEANLRALFRTVKFLGASVGAARETNQHLLSELSALHRALGAGAFADAGDDPSDRSIEARASLLERALNEATEQAVREREFLIAEHDTFIASLIADHEKETSVLRRRAAQAERKLAEREVEDFARSFEDH